MAKSNSSVPVILIVVLCLCCLSLLVVGAGYFYVAKIQNVLTTPGVLNPIQPPGSSPSTVVVERTPVESPQTDTLTILQNTIVPMSDLADLACRLEEKCTIPEIITPVTPLSLGDQQTFWALNTTTNLFFQVQATLRFVSEHVYFWIEDGVYYHEDQLQALGDAFETKIYPTNRDFFGSEWTPGIDGDPHLYILFARNLGIGLAGGFLSSDEYSPFVQKYSNAHEMFVLSADSLGLGEEYTYCTLAHEFQHMIHWNLDRNENPWLNEGLSELACFLNGFYTGGFDRIYLADPDIQLTDWVGDPISANNPHYGASFLFMVYFLDRFGEDAIHDLVSNPLNSLDSVDAVLAENQIFDPLTSQAIRADDVFMDWAVANYLHDASVADGRYTYHNYPDVPPVTRSDWIQDCPVSYGDTVNQYGVDYIRIQCKGVFTLHFSGSTLTRLLPVGPRSGSFAFWSNKGDNSNMTLTRRFDFSGVLEPIQMTYWTWYDLETDYDYLHVEASTDGQHWQILTTPSGTGEDPTGYSYGWGYNGRSNGWIQETVDLSQYAGQQVFLRFDYITDGAVNGEGFLLDDLSIPAVNYSTDFEFDDGGWQAAGFVRVNNDLPQTYRLALITRSAGTATVQMIALNLDQTADIPIDVGMDTEEVILVVSGTTRFTRTLASYSIDIH